MGAERRGSMKKKAPGARPGAWWGADTEVSTPLVTPYMEAATNVRQYTRSNADRPIRAIPLERIEWAYAQDTRNASAKSVLVNLAWRDGTKHAHPGNDRLASDCDLSVRSVHTALKSLVSGGFIVKIEQGRGLKATVYRLDYSIQPATIADRNSIQPANPAIPIGKSCKSNRQPLPPNKKRTRIEQEPPPSHTPPEASKTSTPISDPEKLAVVFDRSKRPDRANPDDWEGFCKWWSANGKHPDAWANAWISYQRNHAARKSANDGSEQRRRAVDAMHAATRPRPRCHDAADARAASPSGRQTRGDPPAHQGRGQGRRMTIQLESVSDAALAMSAMTGYRERLSDHAHGSLSACGPSAAN